MKFSFHRGEVDVAYLLDAPQAQEVKRDPNLRLAFSGGIAVFFLDFLEQWDPKSPWSDKRVRQAASLAIDRKALAEAGYPNGFESADLHQLPPYFSLGEAIVSYFGQVGIRMRMRPMERAAYYTAQRGLADVGGDPERRHPRVRRVPDIDELYRSQARETDRKKREATLHRIQQLIADRVRVAPIYEYIWPSAIGPRVDEPALMLIDPAVPWRCRPGCGIATTSSMVRN